MQSLQNISVQISGVANVESLYCVFCGYLYGRQKFLSISKVDTANLIFHVPYNTVLVLNLLDFMKLSGMENLAFKAIMLCAHTGIPISA